MSDELIERIEAEDMTFSTYLLPDGTYIFSNRFSHEEEPTLDDLRAIAMLYEGGEGAA